jgi:hypothetical protein
VLFLHEVHQVRGALEETFELHFREGWMPAVATNGDARLLWYLHQAHGSGFAYRIVTITAVRDGNAFERLARRVQDGDLRSWARELDGLQHRSEGKLLVAVPWSRITTLDLESVPADPSGAEHDLSLYMEDTGWPHAPLDDYTGFWERVYVPMLEAAGRDRPRLLDIEAVFQPAHGAGRRPEAILVQKVVSHEGLLRLLQTDTPAELKRPGTFMHDALQLRDQWESRLLRTSAWSPLY